MSDPDRSEAVSNGLHGPMGKVPSTARSHPVHPNNAPAPLPPHDSEPLRPFPWQSNGVVFVKDDEWAKPKPYWRRRPLDYTHAEYHDDLDLKDRLNTYFEDAFDNNCRLTLSDIAAMAGYESVVQMTNDARRKGPNRMKLISRSLLALQSEYEEQAASGSRVAMTLLGHIPQFDSREAPEQIATRAFQPQPQEHVVHVSGMERLEDKGRDLSPMDAYNQLIAKPSFQEIKDSIEVQEGEDGVFGLPEVDAA